MGEVWLGAPLLNKSRKYQSQLIPVVNSFIPQGDSHRAKAWIVDPEYLNCRAAYLCLSNQVRTVPFKMVAPDLPPGIPSHGELGLV